MTKTAAKKNYDFWWDKGVGIVCFLTCLVKAGRFFNKIKNNKSENGNYLIKKRIE